MMALVDLGMSSNQMMIERVLFSRLSAPGLLMDRAGVTAADLLNALPEST